MHSLATFVRDFPEFASVATTNAEFVQAQLDSAALEIDADAWGEKVNLGHGLATADAIASSPFGQQAGLAGSNGTVYFAKLMRLRELVGGCYRPVLE